MRSLFVSKFRYYIVFLSVCFAFCSLGGRLIWLQVIESDRFTSVAKIARKNFVSIKARRGDIVDSKGNLLATTRSVVEVGLDPHSLVVEDQVKWKTLATYLGLPLQEIQKAAAKKTRGNETDILGVRDIRWVKLREEVDEGTYRKIQELRIKGVYGNFKHSRLYPNRNLASHVLGFVNIISSSIITI